MYYTAIPRQLQELNIIPLQTNSKAPAIKWKEFQEKRYPSEHLLSWNGNFAVVCGATSNNLVVVDIDSEELFKKFSDIDTFTVKTPKKGYHLYFYSQVYPDRKIKVGGYAVDILGRASYCVIPPSKVNGKSYEVIKDAEILEVEDVLKLVYERLGIEEERKEERIEERKKERKEERIEKVETKTEEGANVDIEKIAEIVKKYYVEGQRQNLILGLAGYLKKKGISQETVEKIVQWLWKKTDDEGNILQRLSAVKYTYSKTDEETAGYTILKELLSKDDLRKLDKVLNNEWKDGIKETEIIKVVENNGKEYYLTKEGWFIWNEKNERYEKICGYFDILKTYRIEKKVGYLLRLKDEDVLVDRYDMKEFEETIGSPFMDVKNSKILLDRLISDAKRYKLFTRTGWLDDEKKVFLHPLLNPELEKLGYDVNLGKRNVRFVERFKDEQHQLVKLFLAEGKLLGVKIAFAVASLFLESGGFTVIDIAENAIGKTTTNKIVGNIFYDTNIQTETASGTKTSWELIINAYMNLPVFLDELALSPDEQVQWLIFSVSSGKGKARSNTKLTVNINDLKSVVFLTTEKDIEFDRFGAIRRFIAIKAFKTEDYTENDLEVLIRNNMDMVGCGTDYIRWLVNHGAEIKTEEWLDKYRKFGNFISYIEKAVIFLEKFYGKEFPELREKIEEVLDNQHKNASRDIFEVFLEEFSNFLFSKQNCFIFGGDIPRNRDIIGKIEDGKIYILTSVFKSFCKEKGFSKDAILKTAMDKGILIPSPDGKYRMKKYISTISETSVYCFVLSELSKIENADFNFLPT